MTFFASETSVGAAHRAPVELRKDQLAKKNGRPRRAAPTNVLSAQNSFNENSEKSNDFPSLLRVGCAPQTTQAHPCKLKFKPLRRNLWEEAMDSVPPHGSRVGAKRRVPIYIFVGQPLHVTRLDDEKAGAIHTTRDAERTRRLHREKLSTQPLPRVGTDLWSSRL